MAVCPIKGLEDLCQGFTEPQVTPSLWHSLNTSPTKVGGTTESRVDGPLVGLILHNTSFNTTVLRCLWIIMEFILQGSEVDILILCLCHIIL